MLRYSVFLLVILGIALFYVFVKNPCNGQLRADFSNKYPTYEILTSAASEGSPESVRCQISYRKSNGEAILEDTWLYQHSGRGWEFSRILETRKMDSVDR